ncbi:MAG: O-antigen ligase family protein [Candidatus Acidiferrum sp.]
MRFFRVGICCLVAFAVFAFGAVEEWSQAVLEVGAAILIVIWAIRQYRRREEQVSISEEWVPLCMFGLVIVAQLGLGLTASRYYTRVELQLLITYLVILFLMSQAFQRRGHWRGFVWFLMSLGFVVSILGILQQLTFNGKLYWFRVTHVEGMPFGPYVNRNHFAGFAEMVIPMALVPLAMGKVRRERIFLVALCAIVPMIALFLSSSRGGIISFGVQMVILFLLMVIRRVHGRFVVVGGVVLLAAVMGVSWIGVQQVLARFSEMQKLEVTTGKRAAMERDTFRLFLDHPIIGTGLGTLEMVYPPYDSLYDGKVVNHAHNDYLEALAETGIIGGVCCLWFLGVLLIKGLKGITAEGNSFGSVLNLSGLVACSGILVHSLVDFNLHIPANALLFLISAHMAVVRLQPTDPAAGASHMHHRHRRKQYSDHVTQTV